jgi:hypothetical protein
MESKIVSNIFMCLFDESLIVLRFYIGENRALVHKVKMCVHRYSRHNIGQLYRSCIALFYRKRLPQQQGDR